MHVLWRKLQFIASYKSGNLKLSLIRDVVWLAQEKSGSLCSPEAYEMILLLSGEIKCAP